MPENYRPICIIPILYKLFSKVVCGRIKKILFKEQSCDQAGFREGFSCDDHLFTVTLLAEKSNEYNLPVWVAAIDFAKAFDSISHRSILEALEAHKVPAAYISVMNKLYRKQTATVKCEIESRRFEIQKGSKQGDPISPLLFNAVLEEVMRKVKAKWAAKRYGVELEPTYGAPLTNLRFADDILLIARTLPQIKQMLADVAQECKKVGLKLHPDKTKILHNGRGYGSKVTNVKINDMVVEVLGVDATTMYLGRSLSLTSTHEAELENRIKKAWSKFGIYREELTQKAIPLRLRLKLFHAVVTPTLLYGCSAWVLKAEQEQRIRRIQMRMMRMIMGRSRHRAQDGQDVESWADWVKRVTSEAKDIMKAHRVPDWVKLGQLSQEKWKNRLESLEAENWAKQVYEWMPIGFRRKARPLKRWGDKEE